MLSPDLARMGGKIQHSYGNGRDVLITIPPNMRAGKQLRLKGMGEAGHAGGESGDLYLTVNIRNPLIQKAKDFISAIRSFGRS